jgi:hypothetical protein
MRGGYLDYEAYLAGSVDANEYRIWHWDCIDIFVYFRSVGQLLGCWFGGGGADPRWVGNWGAGVVAHVPDCCLDYEARIAGSVDVDGYRIWHWWGHLCTFQGQCSTLYRTIPHRALLYCTELNCPVLQCHAAMLCSVLSLSVLQCLLRCVL